LSPFAPLFILPSLGTQPASRYDPTIITPSLPVVSRTTEYRCRGVSGYLRSALLELGRKRTGLFWRLARVTNVRSSFVGTGAFGDPPRTFGVADGYLPTRPLRLPPPAQRGPGSGHCWCQPRPPHSSPLGRPRPFGVEQRKATDHALPRASSMKGYLRARSIRLPACQTPD
jgi:hypothetical protein